MAKDDRGERDYETFRPSWPEQRGSYGEREYGQGEPGGYGGPGYQRHPYGREYPREGYGRAGGARAPYGQEPGFRERIYAWPHESMGMGTNMPYYGGSQYGSSPYGGSYPQPWGGAVGFGSYLPGTPSHLMHYAGYDLMDAGEIEREAARASSAELYGRPSHVGKGPKGYQRTDDRIHEEICERLTRDPWIDATLVEVKVKDGEVKLEGHVHERRIKHMVEDVVASVSGVREIHNGLKVDHHEPGFKGEMKGQRRMGRWGNGGEHDEAEEPRGSRGRSSGGKG